MARDHRTAIIALLAIIVMASGCADNTSDTTITQTQAVEIMNFTAVPDVVYDTQSISLRVRLKNTGAAEATNVKAKIFGPPIGDSKDKWKLMGGANDQNVVDFQDLKPADPDSGLPATPAERIVNLETPTFDQKVTVPYDFKTRVMYSYDTRAVTDITLMGQQRYRNAQVTRTQPVLDNTGGPIQMSVRTRTPIVFYGQDGKYQTSSNLCIVVRNAGTGTPYLSGASMTDVDDSDRVELNIESAGSIEFDAVGQDKSGSTVKVDLVGSKGIQCFEMSNFGFSGEDIERTVPITVKSNYDYYKEAQASVTVKGRGLSTGGEDTSADDDDGGETSTEGGGNEPSDDQKVS